jgi:hypothetical protein
MPHNKLGEEALGLMRRIVEANAWRQYLGVNMLGHCLKMMGDLEGKRCVTREIGVCLDFYGELEDAYLELGGHDLDYSVRDRLLNVPMPESRFELGLCRLLTDRAQRIALASYEGSRCAVFASVAARHLERPALVQAAERERMGEFCGDEANLPRAQETFTRWLSISLLALGRPGSVGDQRALELGLRAKSAEELIEAFLLEMQALTQAWGLAIPSADLLPVEVPARLVPSA